MQQPMTGRQLDVIHRALGNNSLNGSVSINAGIMRKLEAVKKPVTMFTMDRDVGVLARWVAPGNTEKEENEDA